MKNIVMLYKNKDGNIYCQQISEDGKNYVLENKGEEERYWEEGGTITIDELEEILDKEI
jgi:hypothetical protein